MATPIFIGDAVTAAGYRLAGVRVQAPAPGAETAALAAARAEAPLVLVSAAVALRIDATAWRAACTALAPLVLAVPDPQEQVALPDLAGRLRAQLGLEG